MAEYRSGNDAAADEALLAAAKAGPTNRFATGTAAFYRAMSLFRQGKARRGPQAGDRGRGEDEAAAHGREQPAGRRCHHDDLILWLAYKEAKAMIKFEPVPPQKAENDKK